MKKVLIIGPNYFHFNQSVKRAFENLGWRTIVAGYDNPIHPFRGLLKWRRKFSFNRQKLKDRQDAKFNQYIVEVFYREQPDLVFVLNGEILFSKTLDLFRQTTKIALWMYDALQRYPKSTNHINHVDAFFCYEMQDVENYKKQEKTAYFLPQAVDDSIYFEDKEQRTKNKEIDILFVGVLYKYPKRIKLIREVVNKFPRQKILIIGKYKPFEKNPLKWLFREKRNIYTNKNVSVNQVNDFYNRAKIVLNIHHETQTNGANPKVFEICASGAYQICDTNPFIENLFPKGEIALYHTENEMIACISNALKNEELRVKSAEVAREIVLKNHTFTHRIVEVLKIVFIEKV